MTIVIVEPPRKCPKSVWHMHGRKYLKTRANCEGFFNSHPPDWSKGCYSDAVGGVIQMLWNFLKPGSPGAQHTPFVPDNFLPCAAVVKVQRSMSEDRAFTVPMCYFQNQLQLLGESGPEQLMGYTLRMVKSAAQKFHLSKCNFCR